MRHFEFLRILHIRHSFHISTHGALLTVNQPSSQCWCREPKFHTHACHFTNVFIYWPLSFLKNTYLWEQCSSKDHILRGLCLLYQYNPSSSYSFNCLLLSMKVPQLSSFSIYFCSQIRDLVSMCVKTYTDEFKEHLNVSLNMKLKQTLQSL